MPLSKIFICILMSISHFGYSQEKLNTNLSNLSLDKRIPLKPIIFKDVISGFLSFDVREVRDEIERCDPPNNEDYGGLINYCGDIIGGIKNLLQTSVYSTPHVRFLNKPKKNRNIYFYSYGYDMQSSKTLSIWDNKKNTQDVQSFLNGGRGIDTRDIIFRIMADNFNFSVNLIEDSLPELSIRIIDFQKLSRHTITYDKPTYVKRADTDTINNTVYKVHRYGLLHFSFFIEKNLNIYTTLNISTNILRRHEFFYIQIPNNLFSNVDTKSIEELKKYLEENYGLTFETSKKLRKVYEITFNE